MASDTEKSGDLVSGAYEARKTPLRSRPRPEVEVQVRPIRRRRWSADEKLRIVRETLEPGAVAKTVADRHGIGTGLLFTWRREMLAAAMTGFAQVQVVPDPAPMEAAIAAPAADVQGGIEVTFPCGATMRVTGLVDMSALRLVLAELSAH
ncbi:IS66-like element accessory protein TnpA [Roseomonas mucosa]|uniref:IS66-like element accessory protein TnpA n=1 Tax=Roseomonas mucosa TaxID=207340 RepID=UPI00384BA86B